MKEMENVTELFRWSFVDTKGVRQGLFASRDEAWLACLLQYLGLIKNYVYTQNVHVGPKMQIDFLLEEAKIFLEYHYWQNDEIQDCQAPIELKYKKFSSLLEERYHGYRFVYFQDLKPDVLISILGDKLEKPVFLRPNGNYYKAQAEICRQVTAMGEKVGINGKELTRPFVYDFGLKKSDQYFSLKDFIDQKRLVEIGSNEDLEKLMNYLLNKLERISLYPFSKSQLDLIKGLRFNQSLKNVVKILRDKGGGDFTDLQVLHRIMLFDFGDFDTTRTLITDERERIFNLINDQKSVIISEIKKSRERYPIDARWNDSHDEKISYAKTAEDAMKMVEYKKTAIWKLEAARRFVEIQLNRLEFTNIVGNYSFFDEKLKYLMEVVQKFIVNPFESKIKSLLAEIRVMIYVSKGIRVEKDLEDLETWIGRNYGQKILPVVVESILTEILEGSNILEEGGKLINELEKIKNNLRKISV